MSKKSKKEKKKNQKKSQSKKKKQEKPQKKKPTSASKEKSKSTSDNKLKEKVDNLDNKVSKIDSLEGELQERGEQIEVLAKSIGVLNEQFNKFLNEVNPSNTGQKSPQQIKKSPNSSSPNQGPQGGGPAPSQTRNRVPPGAGSEGGKQDKLLRWASVLAQLTGAGGGGKESSGASDMIRLVLQLQNEAEDRALDRQKTAIESFAKIADIFSKGGINTSALSPEEPQTSPPETGTSHLEEGEVE